MGFPLIFIGLILVIVGARGKVDEFTGVLRDDLTGDNSFLPWMIAVFVVTLVGSYKPLRGVGDGLLALVILVLVLSNRGFFVQFTEQTGIGR